MEFFYQPGNGGRQRNDGGRFVHVAVLLWKNSDGIYNFIIIYRVGALIVHAVRGTAILY